MSALRDMYVGINFQDKATKEINKVNKSMDKTHSGFNQLDNDTKDAEGGFHNLGEKARNTGLIIGTALFGAGVGLVAFGKKAVEAAAEAQAMKAQFAQVFGEISPMAQETVDKLGKDFGMAPNRIKPALTQMTSMFKGLGMDTEEAMKTAADATTLVADAAAFYDKSFEDANGALNSFIKGNYEGGESIGLFANETQLAAFASKELGLDWKNLDEKGKQVARLEYAQKMQEAAGATGQAARESNSLTNQTGNLRQVWQDLMAKFGDPILGTVVGIIADLATKVSTVDPQPIIDGFTSIVNKTLEIAQSIQTHWVPIRETVIGLTTAVVAFKTIMMGMTVIKTINTLMAAYRAGTLLATAAQMGLTTAMWASPITWVIAGIAALIAIGVLLYRNWDTVKEKAGQLWAKTKEVFGNIFKWGAEKIQPVVNFFKSLKDKFDDFKSAISSFKMPKWVSSIGNTFSGAASKVKGLFDGSHATGLASVPFDGYTAELHKDESVLTAKQSNALREAGILKNVGSKPVVDFTPASQPTRQVAAGSTNNNTFYFTINESKDGGSTAESVRMVIEDYFGSLGRIKPQVTEG